MTRSIAAGISPASVQAAVFDLGGVLIDGGPSDVAAFGKKVGLAPEAWNQLRRKLFGNEGVWAALERGEATFDHFTDTLRAGVEAAGGTVSDESAAAFMGAPDPMSRKSRLRHDMLDAVKRLHELMPTALLTNNVKEWREGWRQVFDVSEFFDIVVDSSEEGSRKPERRIYEITRERLAVPHENIFFIDDIGQNLKAARGLGWQTFLYSDRSEALEIIETIILSHSSDDTKVTARKQRHGKDGVEVAALRRHG